MLFVVLLVILYYIIPKKYEGRISTMYSNSMSPTIKSKESIIYEVVDINKIKENDIIVYYNDGFEISKYDFTNRGGGDLIGTKQSGELGLLLTNFNKDYQLMLKVKEDVDVNYLYAFVVNIQVKKHIKLIPCLHIICSGHFFIKKCSC